MASGNIEPAPAAACAPDVLDARGLCCPVPILLTRDRLRVLPHGALLEVLGDDPLIVLDMQTFCAREGHEYLGHREEPDAGWRLALRKGSIGGEEPSGAALR